MAKFIDVQHAFDPELRHAQQDMDGYLDARYDENGNLGATAVGPLAYEDMSMSALAKIVGNAHHNDDTTTGDNAMDVLIDKMDAFVNEAGLSDEASKALTRRIITLTGIEDILPEETADVDAGDTVIEEVETLTEDSLEEPEIAEKPAEDIHVSENVESEDNKETLIKLDVGMAGVPLHGEDAMLINSENGLFGVFDGVGSDKDPRAAADAAVRGIKQAYANQEDAPQYTSVQDAVQTMKKAFKSARDTVFYEGGGNSTTAVVTKVEQIDGVPYMIWGNAGDSRLFVSHSDGSFEAISTEQCDELERNRIYNSFGGWASGRDDEFGALPLKAGDRIMLCSDGITGDWDDQRLSEDQMNRAFAASSARDSAHWFLNYSKKDDDKSVIVIDVLAAE